MIHKTITYITGSSNLHIIEQGKDPLDFFYTYIDEESINFVAACERLILLESDPKELRDYSVLLYHCGFYEQSLQYLKLYKEKVRFLLGIPRHFHSSNKQKKSLEFLQGSSLQKQASNKLSSLEEDAVEKLMIRLNLISMEEGWIKPSHARNFLGNNSEPW